MSLGLVDLHSHTKYSDGKLSPLDLIDKAQNLGLAAIAITDHDTIEGVREISNIKEKFNISIIPGVEITVDDDKHGLFDIHVLGLFVNIEENTLNNLLSKSKEARDMQKKAIIERLNDLGYPIDYEEIKNKIEGEIGRPHIAREICERYSSEFKNTKEVFDKLLGNGKKAYVDRTLKISLKDAISAITASGGVPILAHPFCYDNPEKVVSAFKEEGGQGMETIYPYHKSRFNKDFEKCNTGELVSKGKDLAKKHDLIESGGSDFHDDKEGRSKMGEVEVPLEILETIRKQSEKNI